MADENYMEVLERQLAQLPSRNLPKYVLEGDLEKRLSPNALWTFNQKYLRRNEEGDIIEAPREAVYRVANTIAKQEEQYGASDEEVAKWTKIFYDMINNGLFSPGGRVWTNAGTDIKALFNCYVLPVEDNLESIYDSVKHAAIIHKNGGGTGFNFSKIRPRGTYVKTSKGIASGPVSFIKQFDRETEIINSGNRRGANMGIVNIDHPNILDFIYAKTERGEITNFNISVGITDEFMQKVESGDYYLLRFNGKPLLVEDLRNIRKNIEENKAGGSDVGEKPRPPSLVVAESGPDIIDTYKKRVIGRVNDKGYVELHARQIMDTIAELAWRTADPGIVFLDEINRHNSLPKLGRIEATNPCGEQPLHSYDACNLGSINLNAMVKHENGRAIVDYDKIKETTRNAIRFMDNINDISKGPIKSIEETVKRHRRIGYGVMGWHHMLIQLGIPYDSEEALDLARKVMGFINGEAKAISVALAEERGVFPAFEESIYNNGKLEDKVRNVERTTIAPNGTISMLFDVSSGIEPIFAIHYYKNIRGGDRLKYLDKHFERIAKEKGFFSRELIDKIDANHGSIQGLGEVPEDVQRLFKMAHDIHHDWHVKMQAAFQEHVNNAVSKTVNLPKSATVEDVKRVYVSGWKSRLKGITIYREGSKNIQVLETGKKEQKDTPIDFSKIKFADLVLPRSFEQSGIRREYGSLKEDSDGFKIAPSIFVKLFYVAHNSQQRLNEMFITQGKSGGSEFAHRESLGKLISIGLQYGVAPQVYIKALRNIKASTKPFIPDENKKPKERYESIEHLVASLLEEEVKRHGETISIKLSENYSKVLFEKESARSLNSYQFKFNRKDGQESPPLYVFPTENINGILNQIFLVRGESGGDENARMESLGKLVSINLQHGAPPQVIFKLLQGISSDEISYQYDRIHKSIEDAVAWVLFDVWKKKGVNLHSMAFDDEDGLKGLGLEDEFNIKKVKEILDPCPNCSRRDYRIIYESGRTCGKFSCCGHEFGACD